VLTITVTTPDQIAVLMTKMLSSMVVRDDISCDEMDFLSDLSIRLVREAKKDLEQVEIHKK
jgi:hypothetical protein